MTAPGWLGLVDDFLTLRREMGFDADAMRWLLHSFARYADQAGHRGPLTVDLAVRWAVSSRPGDAARAERRLAAVRMFARYRAAFDRATEIPPAGLLGPGQRRKQPHIYSTAEISALLVACRSLRPRDGLRPRTYAAFFSLLASTGLRLSEARRLEHRDVDLASGLITVRAGKFRKSRIVPLHPTAVTALARYASERDAFRLSPRSAFFFRTDHAPALGRWAAGQTFDSLRNSLGWTSDGRARRPRIHDLRHTWTVRRLLRWHEEGADIDRKMLALSTYLGHAKVTGTYWYLSAVPELMAVTSLRFEHFCRREQESAS